MAVKAIRPTETFTKILNFFHLICSLVGADLSNDNYRVNIITVIVILSIIIYFIFTATTVASVFSEDWTYMLEASCMVGSVLQGCTKLISAFIFKNKICGMRAELERLYAEYEVKGDEYVKTLNKSCERMWQVTKVVGQMYLYAAVGIILTLIYFVIATTQKVYVMHFFIPGIDVNTQTGYLITLGVHAVVFMSGAFGLFAGDLFILLFLTQPMLFVDLLVLKVKALNEAAAQKTNAVQRLLIDIIEWHQYYTDYNKRCNHLFYYIISVQIVTSGISIICTLYIILMGDWPGAYMYILIAFSGLYLYCILGTKIQECNSAFCKELCNINFYDLDIKSREMMVLIIMKAQNPVEIKIGGFLPLSVQTALKITKTIYGLFTMMIRFLEEGQ
uniref:Odorant receptor n=1 Tax=Zeugodacus tau TaxID=137263 RepID=A0A6M9TZL2_ZEUTA|nr:odorant receptor [Zeugodacus tau]